MFYVTNPCDLSRHLAMLHDSYRVTLAKKTAITILMALSELAQIFKAVLGLRHSVPARHRAHHAQSGECALRPHVQILVSHWHDDLIPLPVASVQFKKKKEIRTYNT
jgi:hypothetical protein